MKDLFIPPLFETVTEYDREKATADLKSGVTLALMAVPQCMAYALLANVDPIVGLYTAIAAVVIGAVFSSSSFLITGPTAKIALVVGSIAVTAADVDPVVAAPILCLMVGVMQIGAGLLRLGNIARFVSRSVLTGFIMGGALVIIGDQVLYLLRVGKSSSPSFVVRVYESVLDLLETGPGEYWSLVLAAGTIAVMYLFRLIHEQLPESILAIIIGTVFAYFTGISGQVEIIGNIPAGIPMPSLPSPDHLSVWRSLVGGAFALAMLGSVQAISLAKSIAVQTREQFNENRELISQGLANLGTGLIRGFPVSASFSRSFFNFNLGAKTRVSGLICGGVMVLIATFLAPLMHYLPISVLAGLIIVVVADVFDMEEIKQSLATWRDLSAFGITFVSMLVLRLDTAVYIGVLTSIILYLRKASTLDLKEYIVNQEGELEHITRADDRIENRIAIIDVNGEMFFGAANQIKDRIQHLLDEDDDLQVIILRMKNALSMDVTGSLVLEEITRDLEDNGKSLMLCDTTPQIREVLDETGVADVIGEDKILVAQTNHLASARQAITRARAHIDSVLDGEDERVDEADPPLEQTMQELDDESLDDNQDPIEEERVDPDHERASEE